MSPKLPIRTAHCELQGDYAGFWLEIRANPPLRVLEDFAPGDFGRQIAALAELTRASNFVDEHDAPIDLTTVAGWREMPSDLLNEVAARITEVLTLPKVSSNGSATPSSPDGVGSLLNTRG